MPIKTATTLPDDIDTLKAICLERESICNEKANIIEKKDKRIAHLEQMVHYLKLKHYSKSSERQISPEQTSLFNEAEHLADEQDIEDQHLAESPEASAEAPDEGKSKKTRGRRPLPASLPRHKVYHDLEPEKKHCPCGCTLTKIDEVTSEQLVVIPAKILVLQHCRLKYVCSQCRDKAPITATLPPQPLPKSNASPELLAHIAVSKFLDGLPFYRQEKIWARFGVQLSRSTQANWMIGVGKLAQALVNVLVEYQCLYSVMHIDETPVQVLNQAGKPPDSKKYFWVTVGGPPDKQVFRYHYHPSRGSAVAMDLLDGFQGTVMSDDWSVYAGVCEQRQLTHIACNDHARRKFHDAFKEIPKNKQKQGVSKAEMGLQYYRKLYAIERRIKTLSIEEKQRIRQKESRPIWGAFITWIEKQINHVIPSSTLGKALHYTYKLRAKLSHYCEDGQLPMSNEKAENAIRPFAIARKNFLFYDSAEGAKASANLYSLIMTAKHHGLNPYYYLTHVFKHLPLAEAVEDIEGLLPWALTNEQLMESITAVN